MRGLGVLVVSICLNGALLAETKINSSPEGHNPIITPGPGREWIVSYYDSWLNYAVARIDDAGRITYGPAACELGGIFPSYIAVAWSGNVIGWSFPEVGVPDAQIYFQSHDIDGNLASGPVHVSSTSVGGYPCCLDIAWADGKFIVGYVASRNSSTSGSFGKSIAIRVVDESGTIASPVIDVVTVGPGMGCTGGCVSDVQVGAAQGLLFAHWAEGNTSMPGWNGAWFEMSGARTAGPTSYVTQPGYALWEVLSLPDRVVGFYAYRSGGITEPLEQIQIATDGSVLFGPADLVPDDPGLFTYEPVATAPGFGVASSHWQEPSDPAPQMYLRRISSDGSLASDWFPFSSVPGGTIYFYTTMAYKDRAYALVWSDSREGSWEEDLFFEQAGGYELLTTGPGPDPAASPQVALHRPEQPGVPFTQLAPYGAGGYGTNVGAADVDGDDVDEVLTGPGPGAVYGPQVRAFAYGGAPVPKVNFYAYATLRYGVGAAGGRLDGDMAREILTGPGPGEVFGPHVRGFELGAGGMAAIAKVSFYAYSTLRYGARVASADVEADGYDEILTGPGPGAVFGAQLRGFDYDGGSLGPVPGINAFVFSGAQYGLHVTGGDIEGDPATGEIGSTRGPDPAGGTEVALHAYAAGSLSELPGSRFEAFAGEAGGAEVSFVQWWGRDRAREIAVSRGPLPASNAEVRIHDDAAAGLGLVTSFDAWPGRAYGATMTSVFVGF